ncbi:hypothetical protein I3760_13G052300 [Carya illinoinensis]|nr:hypothetical protein I3760_13G052300 [Carya illinoinensis]
MTTEQPGNPMPVGVTRSKYSNRVVLKTILERSDGGLELVGMRVVIGGWVKASKEVTKEPLPPLPPPSRPPPPQQKADDGIGETEPKDSSCMEILQSLIPCLRSIMKGLGFHGNYKLRKSSKQLITTPLPPLPPQPPSSPSSLIAFLQVSDGSCVASLQVASVTRISNALTLATHIFFQHQGFLHMHAPVITTTDCEGFTEKFQVTTLLDKVDKMEKPNTVMETEGVSLEVIKSAAKEKTMLVEELKRSGSNKEALAAALVDLKKTNELASQFEAREKSKSETSLLKAVKLNFSEDFFSCQTYLTVSGRLHLESYACALGNVYSVGPRFRADCAGNVAERSVIEIEMAFSQLEDAMSCADDFFKFLCKWVLDNCPEDMKFVSKQIDKTCIDRLQSLISGKVEKISYAETVDVLGKVEDKKFEIELKWGSALTAEHLSYLVEVIHKKPVMIYNYPKEVKPFYARLNDDGKTVAAFDLVVPKARTLISGSQNEERLDILSSRIKELGLPREQYEWYLDLRRHGTVEHSGFSLGLDQMILFTTGLSDARDVIPFPRSYARADN